MHEKYMKIAIEEAKKGMSNTFTNPLVGAVIVKDGHILSRGAHLEYGYEHAEHNAISKTHSPEDLLNSTLYVTLEPCAHFGKQQLKLLSKQLNDLELKLVIKEVKLLKDY